MKKICVFIALIILVVGISLKKTPISMAENFYELKFYIEGEAQAFEGARMVKNGDDTILICKDIAVAKQIYAQIDEVKCTVIVTDEPLATILSRFDVKVSRIERLSSITCYYGFSTAVNSTQIDLFGNANNIQISDSQGVRCVGFPIILTDF